MKRIIMSIFGLLVMFGFNTIAGALTIVETTIDDEYDTIQNNSIIIGVTKFEPNEVLTAGKASLATYNDVMFDKPEETTSSPKIYYYLQGSWFEIDVDNNAKVIEDTNIIESLNSQDIYYVNNVEKVIDLPYVMFDEEKYDLVLESSDITKNDDIKYENNILSIPASIVSVKVSYKDKESGETKEIETLEKENRNSVEFKIIKKEIIGEDGTFKYVILSNGKIQISRYIGSETDVVIPAEYDGYKVYSVGNINAGNGFEKSTRYNIFGETNTTSNSTIKSITISEGIEIIETAAFNECTGLTGELILPKSLKRIGVVAFNGCSGLTGDLIIPDNVTSVGAASFQYCSGFDGTLTLPSNIKKIEQFSFYKCTNLTGNVVVPEGVTSIGKSAFNQCSKLNGTLSLPSTLVELGAYSFNRCTGLTGDLIIPEGVSVISEGAFQGCSGFDGKLTLPSTLTEIEAWGFNSCSNLIGDLTIPEGVTKIGKTAFQNCSGFDGKLTLPKSLTGAIDDWTFFKCTGLTGDLVIPEGVTKIGKSAFYGLKLTGKLTLPSTLEEIGDFAFDSSTNLTGDLIIPEGTKKIGKAAFQSCSGFNGILTLPSTLEEISSYAFNHCSGFTNKTLTIPKSVKLMGANGIDASHIFYDFATKTIEEYIVEEGSEYFKSVDGVLLNKDGTRLVAYPANKVGNTYEIPEGVTIIDELAFSRAGSGYSSVPETGLKKLILPNSYILTTTLPDEYINSGNNLAVGLYSYTGVNEIQVKENNPNYKTVDGVLYSKDGTVLWYVPTAKIENVEILDGVTTIKDGAFFEYRSHTVTIPASITHIEDRALKELKIMGKSKVTFAEGCIYQFNSSGQIVKQ